MSYLHPRVNRWLALTLAAVWVVAVASGDAVLTPGMGCHGMPCCPQSDGGMQGCSTAQCTEQLPEKAENQAAAKEAAAILSAVKIPSTESAGRPAIAQRELTPGLRVAITVFRLKDDLRI